MKMTHYAAPASNGRRWVAAVLAPIALLATGLAAAQNAAPAAWFADVLDAPAVISRRVPRLETVGVAKAGEAWVAVGARGVILRSVNGEQWTQVPVPVRADLTSVFFVDSQHGWAVGHDAVILKTEDGGLTWARQLDGRRAAAALSASYAKLQAAGEAYAGPARAELNRMFAASGNQPIVSMPFLDVWFRDRNTGYAVGAFNLLFTTRDGGANWAAADHLADNPKGFHLNAVRGGPAGVFIASEQGVVLRLDEKNGRFSATGTDYKGSFSGVYNEANELVVYGLRGNARASADGGRSWTPLKLASASSIVNVLSLGDKRLLYVLQDGKLFVRNAQGGVKELDVRARLSGEVYGAVLLDNRRLLTTGLGGPTVTNLGTLPY